MAFQLYVFSPFQLHSVTISWPLSGARMPLL